MQNNMKAFLFLENIVCCYRNYVCLGKVLQRCICVRVILESSLVFLITCVRNIYAVYEQNQYSDAYLFYLRAFFTVYLMYASIYNSSDFRELMSHINSLMNLNQGELQRKLNIRTKTALGGLLFCQVTQIVLKVVYYLETLTTSPRKLIDYFFEIHLLIEDLRIAIEFAVIIYLIFAKYDLLNCLVKSIDSEIKYTKENKPFDELNDHYCSGRDELFATLSNAYMTIEKYSRTVNVIFSFQTTAMISIIILNYILLQYGVTQQVITGHYRTSLVVLFIHVMVQFLAALMLLSFAAQKACNKADILKQKLATLLVCSVRCKAQYASTLALLRVVRAHPIHMTVFGSVHVDMTLVPAYIALCTSYTVVALQFQNIL